MKHTKEGIKRTNFVFVILNTTILTFLLTMSQTFAQDRIPGLPPEWTAYIDMVDEYCFNNVDKILAGGNPVQDLIDAGLIPDKPPSEDGLAGVGCDSVHKMKKFNDEGNRLGIPWG